MPSELLSPRVDSLLLIALRLFRVFGDALISMGSGLRVQHRAEGIRCDRKYLERVHLGAPVMRIVQENCFLKYQSRGQDISLDNSRFDRGWVLLSKTTGSAEVTK